MFENNTGLYFYAEEGNTHIPDRYEAKLIIAQV